MAKIGAKESGLMALRASGREKKPAREAKVAPPDQPGQFAAEVATGGEPPMLKDPQSSSAPPSGEQQEVSVRNKTSKKSAKAKARTPVKAKGKTSAKNEGVRPGSKLEKIVGLLKRAQGCTTADVLKATGWPTVSMPQQAKAAGVTLKKEKKDGVTIYRAA